MANKNGIQVSHKGANKVLLEAFNSRAKQSDEIGRAITYVINGNHKTYRYTLVTALLAKATDERIDPLCLQSGADSAGSYDARGVCHKVLVPFERNYLSSGLGGSNEPYLNKPARFPKLSSTNAVRAGSDRVILLKSINILENINNSADAKKYLSGALYAIIERVKSSESILKFKDDGNDSLCDVYYLILKLLQKSMMGEVPVLVVASLEILLYANQSNTDVLPHKVNQSGSSSKEVGDIDIYVNNKISTAIEVKDKDFAYTDMEHAIEKCKNAGVQKCMFIAGVNAAYKSEDIKHTLDKYASMGVICAFSHIIPFVRMMLFQITDINKAKFISTLSTVSSTINCKDETVLWVKSVIDNA